MNRIVKVFQLAKARPIDQLRFEGSNMIAGLIQSVNKLRKAALQTRKLRGDNPLYYSIKTLPQESYYIEGHPQLGLTQQTPISLKGISPIRKAVTGQVMMAISSHTFYPYFMGYVTINNKPYEAYHVFINGKEYTLLGISYTANPRNPFGDMISFGGPQAMRFDYLPIIKDLFPHSENMDPYTFSKEADLFRAQIFTKWTDNKWPKVFQYRGKKVNVFRVIQKIDPSK